MVNEYKEGLNKTKETGPKRGWFRKLFIEPALESLGESIIRAQGHEPGFLDYLAEHEEEIKSSFKRASELSKTAHPQNAEENWQAIFGGLGSLVLDYRRLQEKYDNEARERRLRALLDREQRETELKSERERKELLKEQIKKHERN